MTSPIAEAAEVASAEAAAEPGRPVQLRRSLAGTDCVLLVIGSMVGSGIFLTTGQIAGLLPSPWLILTAWLIGGAMALAGALTYAELGAALPRAGGHYCYLREAYGPLVGFFDGWLSFVASFAGSIAFVSLGLVAYLPPTWAGHPVWTAQVAGLQWTVTSSHAIAVAVIAVLSVLNGLGLRAGSGTQNVLTCVKLAALAGIAGLGLLSGRGQWSLLASGGFPSGGGAGLGAFGAALIGVSFAYLGWDAATYMGAEVRRPQRTLPRSLALGTLVVIALYLAFNAALLRQLPTASLAVSQNATRAVVGRLLGPQSAGLLSAAIVIALLGSLNATVMVGPRIYYAMARDGLFPRLLGTVHRRTRVPVAALAAQAVWSSVIVLSSTLGRILAFTVLVIWLLSAITGAAVFVLRWRRPGLERPYRVWGYPWVPGFFCLASLALIGNHLAHTPGDVLWLIGFLVAGVPVYLMMRSERRVARRLLIPMQE